MGEWQSVQDVEPVKWCIQRLILYHICNALRVILMQIIAVKPQIIYLKNIFRLTYSWCSGVSGKLPQCQVLLGMTHLYTDVVLSVCLRQTEWRSFVFSQAFIIEVTENGSILYPGGKLRQEPCDFPALCNGCDTPSTRQHERRSPTTPPLSGHSK